MYEDPILELVVLDRIDEVSEIPAQSSFGQYDINHYLLLQLLEKMYIQNFRDRCSQYCLQILHENHRSLMNEPIVDCETDLVRSILRLTDHNDRIQVLVLDDHYYLDKTSLIVQNSIIG